MFDQQLFHVRLICDVCGIKTDWVATDNIRQFHDVGWRFFAFSPPQHPYSLECPTCVNTVANLMTGREILLERGYHFWKSASPHDSTTEKNLDVLRRREERNRE